MKKLIMSLLILTSISLQAATDSKMKMKMTVDKTPNMIIINIIPETEEEYMRLLEIIERSKDKPLIDRLQKHLETLKNEKSYLKVKEDKDEKQN